MINTGTALRSLRAHQEAEISGIRRSFQQEALDILDSIEKDSPDIPGLYGALLLPLFSKYYGKYIGDTEGIFFTVTRMHVTESYYLAGDIQRSIVAEAFPSTRDLPFGVNGVEKDVSPNPLLAAALLPLRQVTINQLNDLETWVDPNGRVLGDRFWVAKDADYKALMNVVIASAGSQFLRRTVQDFLNPKTSGGNYGARRIARAEASRGFHRALIRTSLGNEFIEALKWNVAAGHADADLCDDKAERGSRGLGRGEYLPSESPSPPSHPNCRCYLTPILVRNPSSLVARLLSLIP